ncbi:3-deoxy-D-manno-octulosonic acid transferase [Sutterella sp.]|uniref:3-deoxy-D-manno-octulosonic acid transferase n=1 Tax=Sutterella sp. TaxID=1981025 RepID=UPI0026E0A9DB|nr:3-deoxy-D-manno-octulosonic acid transferase [Sutterella sp.]MDO5531036.1 3-deoxy-D-manno-octulosonic acid transferase [Sutterella sp.]
MKITPGIYRCVTTVALPLASLYLMWRSRRQPAYRDYWDERFAWGTYPLRQDSRPRVWIHAVSVGETNAARPLLEAMLKAWPECDVVLTHMTPTGREAGKKLVRLAPERIHQCYLPYDAPYAVEKFVRQTRPTLGVIMETEVWPNLIEELARRQIPVVLANARESEKSRAQAEKVIDVMRPAFGSFSAVLAQSDEDKERLESLGARDVEVTGSLKFDIRADASQVATAHIWREAIGRPVLLLASTRQGEEEMFLDALKKHPELTKTVQIVLVPRHPERFTPVAEQIRAAGLKVARRSGLSDPKDIPEGTDVILGDSMGEMSFYCALATFTIMGGSFANCGSQNVVEPALAGSPVIVGPSTFNFDRIIREGIAAGGMVQVKDADGAFGVVEGWIAEPGRRAAAAEAARTFAQGCAGATDRMMKILEKLWSYARKNESRMY